MSDQRTTHDDLMDLGSRWSYSSKLEIDFRVYVNGTWFIVKDVETDAVTGLDAFTFENDDTGELTIGFQGTADVNDVLTDVMLVTPIMPAQYTAAQRYVQKMSAKFGPVSSVCGNSLGGGLAAYVAARNSNITAVTVNPAPVPKEYANVDAPNVHNYVSSADILRRLVKAGGLHGGIIGNTTEFPGTSFNHAFVLPNHIGSDREDGQYDGSMAVPFSIFHTDKVLAPGRFGAKVDIDSDALEQLAAGLTRQREDLRVVVDTEVGGLEQVLEQHVRTLQAREAVVREGFLDLAEEGYAMATRLIGQLLDQLDATMRSPLMSMPAVPAPLRIAWVPLRDQLMDAVGDMGRALDELAGFTIRAGAAGVWDACCPPLFDESEVIADGLAAQCGVLRDDLSLVDDKWSVLGANTAGVAREVSQADAAIAAAIAARQCPPDAVRTTAQSWPVGTVDPLSDDIAKQFTQVIVEIRQTVVGELVVELASGLAYLTVPLESILLQIDVALEVAEAALSSAVRQVQTAIWFVQHSPTGLVAQAVGLADDLRGFSRALGDVRSRFVSRMDMAQDLVRSVLRTLAALPDAVEAMRPYLHESFFADAQIEQAYDALLKCRNLVGRSQLTFGEVDFQLADHDARMIDALAENARNLRGDLSTIETSLTVMVA